MNPSTVKYEVPKRKRVAIESELQQKSQYRPVNQFFAVKYADNSSCWLILLAFEQSTGAEGKAVNPDSLNGTMIQ